MLKRFSHKLQKASPQKLTQWLAIFILCTLSTYLWLTYSIELPSDNYTHSLKQSDYIIFAILALASYCLRAARWIWMSSGMNLQVPKISNITIYVAGFALSATPGHVAELAKVVFLRQFNVSPSQAVILIFNDRFLDIITAALIACLLITQIPQIATALLIFLAILGLSIWLLQAFGRKNFHKKLAPLAVAIRTLLSPKIFSAALLLSILSWLCQSAIFYLIVSQFIDINFLTCAGIYMTALALGALSMMPGGIGAAEISIGGLLSLFGVDVPTASFIALFTRLFTFWPALLLGWVSLSILSFGRPSHD